MKHVYCIDAAPATTELTKTLRDLLQDNKKVLWIVSGGSGAQVSIDVARQLQDLPLTNLFVTLSDERYGPIGHADENWQQLLDGGFSLPGAKLYRILDDTDRTTTTSNFNEWITTTQSSVDYTVGLFGIGPDGHTAGIKPSSLAASSSATVTSFIGEDFERITITPVFITKIDEAVTQAFGEDKFPVIEQLLSTTLPVETQPAQILKHIPKSTLYTNYKEN